MGFPGGSITKESACSVGDVCLNPRLGRFPWRRAWLPTPVFLPGEDPWTEEHGQLHSMGSWRVSHNWVTKHSTHLHESESVSHSVVTLCDTMDCSLPGSSVHGILQARILEWVAMPSSRGIFPTQGSNPGILHCRQVPYSLSCHGSPKPWYVNYFEISPNYNTVLASLKKFLNFVGVSLTMLWYFQVYSKMIQLYVYSIYPASESFPI